MNIVAGKEFYNGFYIETIMVHGDRAMFQRVAGYKAENSRGVTFSNVTKRGLKKRIRQYLERHSESVADILNSWKQLS